MRALGKGFMAGLVAAQQLGSLCFLSLQKSSKLLSSLCDADAAFPRVFKIVNKDVCTDFASGSTARVCSVCLGYPALYDYILAAQINTARVVVSAWILSCMLTSSVRDTPVMAAQKHSK